MMEQMDAGPLTVTLHIETKTTFGSLFKETFQFSLQITSHARCSCGDEVGSQGGFSNVKSIICVSHPIDPGLETMCPLYSPSKVCPLYSPLLTYPEADLSL